LVFESLYRLTDRTLEDIKLLKGPILLWNVKSLVSSAAVSTSTQKVNSPIAGLAIMNPARGHITDVRLEWKSIRSERLGVT
jgi:hypothetical protein